MADLEYTGRCHHCEKIVLSPLRFCCNDCAMRWWQQVNIKSWKVEDEE